jgi:transcriptional regulator with XRE-family HTH domain
MHRHRDASVRAVPKGSPELVALGGAIRELRAERGLSQEALADNAGMHRTYVGGIERGERNVAFMNILNLAGALGVSSAELLTRYERVRKSRGR